MQIEGFFFYDLSDDLILAKKKPIFRSEMSYQFVTQTLTLRNYLTKLWQCI